MRKNKGITLIVLIITIIVMLILAGVSISVVVNGGLFSGAKNSISKQKVTRADAEALQITVSAQTIQKAVGLTLKQAVSNAAKGTNFEGGYGETDGTPVNVDPNSPDEGPVDIKDTETGRIYEIDSEYNLTPVSGITVAFEPNGGTAARASTKVTVTNTGDTGVKSDSLQYVWSTSSTDPAAGYTAFTNGAELTSPGGLDGTYYLWIKASDNGGVITTAHSNSFTLDGIAPAITISEPSSTIAMSGSSITYTVTYADTNFNTSTLEAGNIILNKTGTATGTIAVAGTGTTRTVTISGITGNGTVRNKHSRRHSNRQSRKHSSCSRTKQHIFNRPA